MMQTAAVQKISEQNSHKPGEKPHKSRQGTPGKKKVFCHAEVKRRCITDFHGRSNQDFRGGCNNSVYNRSFRVIHAFIQRNVDYQ